MHLTNSSHDSDVSGYKMDSEMMYYSVSVINPFPSSVDHKRLKHSFVFSMLQNTSSELNHTTDGFINEILNDEDLLMDMGVNEGKYFIYF